MTCPDCTSPLHQINEMLCCPKCSYYTFTDKHKPRIVTVSYRKIKTIQNVRNTNK